MSLTPMASARLWGVGLVELLVVAALTGAKSAPLGEIYQPSQVSVAYPPPNLVQPLP